MSRISDLAREARQVLDAAELEDRPPSRAEQLYAQSLLDQAERLKSQRKGVPDMDAAGHQFFGHLPMSIMGDGSARMLAAAPNWGEVFTQSSGYKSIANPETRGQRWSSGAVQVSGFETKGTLLEGEGAPGSGSGGGFIPVPSVVPGVVDTLFRPTVFADLILSGQTSSSSIRYAIEGTADSGAAGVSEGGTKPESTIGVGVVDEYVKKIATVCVASDGLLEDVAAVQSFIGQRLSLFVRLEEERQLLRGSAGGAEVQGLLTSRNVPIYGAGTVAGNRAEQIFKAMNGMRGSAFVEPDWIAMDPADYEIVRLLKDDSQQYLGGGPFGGQYGSGGQAASGAVGGLTDTLWGKPVYLPPLLGAGTALVRSRASAQVWRRGGINVEMTNSHLDFFTLNLVAIRAEERLGVTLFRPGGYVEVRLA